MTTSSVLAVYWGYTTVSNHYTHLWCVRCNSLGSLFECLGEGQSEISIARRTSSPHSDNYLLCPSCIEKVVCRDWGKTLELLDSLAPVPLRTQCFAIYRS